MSLKPALVIVWPAKRGSVGCVTSAVPSLIFQRNFAVLILSRVRRGSVFWKPESCGYPPTLDQVPPPRPCACAVGTATTEPARHSTNALATLRIANPPVKLFVAAGNQGRAESL